MLPFKDCCYGDVCILRSWCFYDCSHLKKTHLKKTQLKKTRLVEISSDQFGITFKSNFYKILNVCVFNTFYD